MTTPTESSRMFSLAAILSITDGHLFGKMDIVYEIVNYLTGDDISTIGLLAAQKPCAEALLEQHPQLASVDGSGVNGSNWRAFLAEQEKKFGAELPVAPMRSWTPRSVADDILDVNLMNPDAGIMVVEL